MPTRQATIDYLLDQLAGSGDFSARKMFGEYCLYLAGKPVALVCDDQLYLKPTPPARARLDTPQEAAPYPGAKPHLLVTGDLWEDRDALAGLLHATASALPASKPRPAVKAGPKAAPKRTPKAASKAAPKRAPDAAPKPAPKPATRRRKAASA